jgi:hypothetical protein
LVRKTSARSGKGETSETIAFGDIRQDVKQDVFAGHLAVLDLEGDIPEGPDGVVFPGKGALLNR